MKAYLTSIQWDFARYTFVVLATSEKAAKNKTRKAYPDYEIVSIDEYKLLR